MDAIVEPTEQANPGDEHLLRWWDGYLNGLIAISLFGGQITFTVIISEIANPATLDPTSVASRTNTRFERETVRMFVALSWLLFMVPLGIAVVTKMLLLDVGIREYIRINLADGHKCFMYIPSVLSFLLNALPVIAFLFLALAVVAYVPVVGWIGVGLISLFILIVFVLWIIFDA
ncbi:hypothetical protein B0J14DRAFT_580248 [Halenospora varia]|nr:hypothetical protein B0J14DRAFT_580248 [Halenospora varia]